MTIAVDLGRKATKQNKKKHAQSINKIFNKMHLDLQITIVVSSFMIEITRIQIKIETENK